MKSPTTAGSATQELRRRREWLLFKLRYVMPRFPENRRSFQGSPIFSRPPAARHGFPRTRLVGRSAFLLTEPARELVEDRGAVALAGNLAAELAIEQRLDADRKTMRITCNLTERRKGSSSAMGHDRISWMSLSDMPSKCSIFSADDQCRHPRGRLATRGMRGNAMTLPSSARTPAFRALRIGQPGMVPSMARQSRFRAQLGTG
jgi:hypothetical protein